MVSPVVVWPPEHAESLKALLARGLSASQIADGLWREFRASYTRNAICGKIMRMKLGGQSKQKGGGSKPQGPQPLRVRNPVCVGIAEQQTTLEPVLDAPRTTSRNLPLIELGPDDCRYPFGDRDFVFCGHRQMEGSSYCPEHFWISRRL